MEAGKQRLAGDVARAASSTVLSAAIYPKAALSLSVQFLVALFGHRHGEY